jgi:ferrochelatase
MAKYNGIEDYQHNSQPRTGILVTNLGTPDSPDAPAIRRYLAEFLSDPRVIETNKLIWWPILHGIILRTRPKKSAHAYEKVWTEAGSPLLVITRKQKDAIAESLAEQVAGPLHIEFAMRYGNPSITSALEKMQQANVQRLLVFPLYPQYSATTTASTLDAVTDVLKTWRLVPELRFIRQYYDDPAYIDALVDSIRDHWAGQDRASKLVFSFHGLPKSYFLAGDPYFCHCQKTARLVVEQLELKDDAWQLCFQSRFGALEWLKPYTDETLKNYGREGVESVDIISPGFSADCLETLEEINMQNREFFLQAGGKEFSYIPALNDAPKHIDALCGIITRHCQGWPEFSDDYEQSSVDDALRKSEQNQKEMISKS